MHGYSPAPGDVVSLAAGDGTPRTVVAVQMQSGQWYAVCTWPWGDGGRQILTESFILGSLNLISGAGTAFFTTAAGGGNTGSGAINSGSVVNGNVWVSDTYTITFTSGTTYSLKSSKGATITSGGYANPTPIQFLGVSVTISGTPAAGDTFTITANF